MKYCWIAILLTVMVLLTGCSNFVDRDQLHHTESGTKVTLEPGCTLGQTLVARHAGLNGMDIWLASEQGSKGKVHLYLRSDPQTDENLAETTLSLDQVTASGFHHFSFPSHYNSHNEYYYAFLEMTGEGSVQIGLGPGDAYLDGAFYQDHQPVDAQMVFRLTYQPRYILLDLLWATIEGMGLLVVAGFLYVVPGWALLVLFQQCCSRAFIKHWAEEMGVAIGLSLALYPILFLWTNVLGVHLGALYAWLPPTGGLMILLWRYRPWQWKKHSLVTWFKRKFQSKDWWADIALIIIIGLASIGRFLAVRGLDMPLWDDSIQHTVIVKRILESRGLFQSWAPYAPYQTLSFHFGFHANVAVFAWLTHLDAPQSLLWAGQILNLLAVLTLYPLAYRIKGAWAGVIVILVSGMLTKFPAYYSNWGRYPQMSGQAILPVAAWWLWRILRSDKTWHTPSLLGGAYLTAGMGLTYYRMPFHYFAFATAAILVPFKPTKQLFNRWDWLAPIVIVVVAGILLFPWAQEVASRHWSDVMPTRFATQSVNSFSQQVRNISIGWSVPMASLIFLGTLASIWAGGATALPVLWLWLLAGLPILQVFPLPGVHFLIQEFTINTSLYIIQALIWGGLGGLLIDRLVTQPWRSFFLALVVVSVGIWKLPSLLTIIDREHDLSTRSDIRAAKWVSESLPDNAFFLHNGIIYTDGYSAVGGDAGWWLPVLAQRGVVIPPQYALHVERPSEPDYSQAVNELVQHFFKNPPNTLESREVICNFIQPITHVYLGQRRGMVAATINPPPRPMLPANLLLQDPSFRLIYHQDRVMIFEFDREVCP